MAKSRWQPAQLQLLSDALKDLGGTEECAKFLVEALPEHSPRTILRAAMRGNTSLDNRFRRHLISATTDWLTYQYGSRVEKDGQVWLGITRLRKYLLQTFKARQLEGVGLWPMPMAAGLRAWLKAETGSEKKVIDGRVVYPLAPVEKRIRFGEKPSCETEDELIMKALEARRTKLSAAVAQAQRELHQAQELRNAAYVKYEAADAALRAFETKLQALEA